MTGGIEAAHKLRERLDLVSGQEERRALPGALQRGSGGLHGGGVLNGQTEGAGDVRLLFPGRVLLAAVRVRNGWRAGAVLLGQIGDEIFRLFHEHGVVIDLAAGREAQDGVALGAVERRYGEAEMAGAEIEREIDRSVFGDGGDIGGILVLVGHGAVRQIEYQPRTAPEQHERLPGGVVGRSDAARRRLEYGGRDIERAAGEKRGHARRERQRDGIVHRDKIDIRCGGLRRDERQTQQHGQQDRQKPFAHENAAFP